MVLYLEDSSPINATLYVTYPKNSTCLCVNSGHVLKARDASGSWGFKITEPGNWIVSCTDGTNSDTKIVEVKKSQIIKINLTYWDGTLYDGSLNDSVKNQYKDITGGWRLVSGGTLTLNATNMKMGNAPSQYSHTYVATTSLIDLTYWNTITVTATGYATLQIYQMNRVMGNKVKALTLSIKNQAASLDISSLTGEYYIGFDCGGTQYESVGWAPASCTVTKIQLSGWTDLPSYDFNYKSGAVGYIIIEGTAAEISATSITKDSTTLSPSSTTATKWICPVPSAGIWTVVSGSSTWTVLIGSGQVATIMPKFTVQSIKPDAEVGFLSSVIINPINIKYTDNEQGGQEIMIGEI